MSLNLWERPLFVHLLVNNDSDGKVWWLTCCCLSHLTQTLHAGVCHKALHTHWVTKGASWVEAEPAGGPLNCDHHQARFSHGENRARSVENTGTNAPRKHIGTYKAQ